MLGCFGQGYQPCLREVLEAAGFIPENEPSYYKVHYIKLWKAGRITWSSIWGSLQTGAKQNG
jgi:hypothetical protein